ncbi:DNA-binding protein [Ktedonosporobacter rubrisoli]|uniref:DNA-binding protein n=1 Tax=Ktedonosporobacter rubrisoli TaxID=2509675 RepID=A0A4V0YZ69_KTERU|nr:helix-turn-helix domain-containing protein [Ktedonosporobacter rubrisoli]QBD78681.1 DNA-binding protein [Ktedonosporobacter rubrisoli]
MANIEDWEIPEMPGFISTQQAANILGVTQQRIHQYITEQRLEAYRAGSIILVSEQSVREFKPHLTGRPRKRKVSWRVYRGESLVLATEIEVRVRPGQQTRLAEKLQSIRQAERHIFTGSIARYILEDSATSDLVSIWLVWKDSELPEPAQQERELAAFRAELDDVLDWQTARYQHKKGLLYT